MSDNIPFEMQVEIIKRVPVKPLLKFRSVSKQWKSLIDSPEFAADYCVRQSQPHRLLIRYNDFEQFNASIHNGPVNYIPQYKFVSVADDDTFHQFPTTTVPKSLNNLKDLKLVGCSHGLFCFYGYDLDQPCPFVYRDGSYMVVLWNPWIRKFVDVPVPNVLFERYETILGFGVSPQTKDPKIVKIISFFRAEVDTSVRIPWRMEVFTLSSGTWKSPSCSINNLPCRNSIRFDWSQVALDGFIYWHAFEMINVDGRFRDHNLIMSFDLTSEEFEEVCLPNSLVRLDKHNLSLSKRMESVVVLEIDETGTSYGVWMMGQGVTKSFTKLFNVMTRGSPFYIVCGFMKNGEPIVDHGSDALFAYDPYSERIKDLGIVVKSMTISVDSYMETLLLIDQ